MPDLSEWAERVDSRDSLLAFVDALAAERLRDAAASETVKAVGPYGPTALGWRNLTIEAYLEAAAAYARDKPLFSETLTWRDVAMFLLAGKSYE